MIQWRKSSLKQFVFCLHDRNAKAYTSTQSEYTGAKAFLLVTDNRRSRLDSRFCVITQHRKFEFGHHRQSKKISNAQELTMQLSLLL